jgi:transcriptional regulator with XRE-family HTH domain
MRRPSSVPGVPARNPAVPPGAAAPEAPETPEADSGSWEQVRSELGLNTADVARHPTRLEGGPDAGACRLAEIRKHRGVTQQDLAETLGVSQSRVSQIERQSIDDTVVSTLAAYVEALGASIVIRVDFGEERFVLRRGTGSSILNETGTAAGPASERSELPGRSWPADRASWSQHVAAQVF